MEITVSLEPAAGEEEPFAGHRIETGNFCEMRLIGRCRAPGKQQRHPHRAGAIHVRSFIRLLSEKTVVEELKFGALCRTELANIDKRRVPGFNL
jgi:hypothetical protein